MDLVEIHEAVEGDRCWVKSLMLASLNNFYDGDHNAHAERILNAHISGGHDILGFFSNEQKMFIAKSGNVRIGLLHLVGKKQNTYKISPLIVDSKYRANHGIGKKLLQYAISYAKKNSARQLYCTVAEQNIAAFQFFTKNGFVMAGSSNSHYKKGIVEHMLYIPINSEDELLSLDRNHISVRPLSEIKIDIRSEIRELLLASLPKSFSGVDDKWIDSLFDGYDRRKYKDVNSKYKLLFAATNSHGSLLGVAGATPKKGNPIKLMPFIAQDDQSFEALLTDIPFLLKEYGHKIYIHIEPNPNQVIILQKLGWKINALLPSAYMCGVTTQQWSYDINHELIRTMRIKNILFKEIQGLRKTVEVRVGYESIRNISIGEIVKFKSDEASIKAKVTGLNTYASLDELLDKENYKDIIPYAENKSHVREKLSEFYSDEKIALGIYAISFEVQ